MAKSIDTSDLTLLEDVAFMDGTELDYGSDDEDSLDEDVSVVSENHHHIMLVMKRKTPKIKLRRTMRKKMKMQMPKVIPSCP